MQSLSTPDWGLTLAYWLHMLATVVWVGSLLALVFLVFPLARSRLSPESFSSLLEAAYRRVDPLGWFCLALLTGTGMFQMSASPNYAGFLAVNNSWALAILLKHGLFFALIGSSAYVTWGLLPELRRQAVRRLKGLEAPDAERLERRSMRLMRFNLLLVVAILAFTAAARVF